VPGFDVMRPTSELAQAGAEADHLVLLSPHTPATHHMIDARVIAAMKPTAYLINLARGGVLDETALLEAPFTAGVLKNAKEPDIAQAFVASLTAPETDTIATCAFRRYITSKGTLIASYNWHVAEQFPYRMKMCRLEPVSGNWESMRASVLV
jgi:hypothetical protein